MKVMMQKLNWVKYAYTEAEQKELERKGFQVVKAEKLENRPPIEDMEDHTDKPPMETEEPPAGKQLTEGEKKPSSGGRRGVKKDESNG